MKFDESKFFAAYRAAFGPIPADKPYIISGLKRHLWGFETYYGWWDDLDQIANALAQVRRETAYSYTPVAEAYYLGDATKPNFYSGNTAHVRRIQENFRYYPFFGRGDIQLTWEENYRKMNTYLRKYFPEIVAEVEVQFGKPFDLVKYPQLALHGKVSFATYTVGMHLGVFRPGKTLDRYITPTKVDHYMAREVVNGDKGYKDKTTGKLIGRMIEEDAKKFTTVLQAALVTEPDNTLDGLIASIGEAEGVTAAPSPFPEAGGEWTEHGIFAEPAESPSSGAFMGEQPGDRISPPVPNSDEAPKQVAENITNVNQGGPTVPPDFVPEDKIVAAPPPSNMLQRGWRWILGLGLLPTTGGAALESIRSLSSDGQFNVASAIDVGKGIFILVMPYMIWVGIAFIVFWGLKEILKQVSLIVTQYTMARGDMNNVTVVPTRPSEKTYELGSWKFARVDRDGPPQVSVIPTEEEEDA